MSTSDEKPPFFYANIVRANMGPYDVTFQFGRQRPGEHASEEFAPLCEVAMSPSHAKTMIPILAKLIQQYEASFGPIPSPGYGEKAKEEEGMTLTTQRHYDVTISSPGEAASDISVAWDLLGYEMIAVDDYEEAILSVPDVQAGLDAALGEIEAWKNSLSER